jgi:hypothetical protein
MWNESMYEKWRHDRSQVDPPEGFADRVMREIQSLPLPERPRSDGSPAGASSESNRLARFARLGVCAAAGLAALFRVAELLSVFSATGIDN